MKKLLLLASVSLLAFPISMAQAAPDKPTFGVESNHNSYKKSQWQKRVDRRGPMSPNDPFIKKHYHPKTAQDTKPDDTSAPAGPGIGKVGPAKVAKTKISAPAGADNATVTAGGIGPVGTAATAKTKINAPVGADTATTVKAADNPAASAATAPVAKSTFAVPEGSNAATVTGR